MNSQESEFSSQNNIEIEDKVAIIAISALF
jgi:hypothetical protein